ncbi:MAG: GNAT family N-acetyltransferase [Gemmatimonadota bacterium]
MPAPHQPHGNAQLRPDRLLPRDIRPDRTGAGGYLTQPVVVRAVTDSRTLKKFIDLPYRLYERDPVWVPPLRRDVQLLLSREKNPFFEHAEAEYFLAERGSEVVGRIAAIHNRLHNETHEDSVGFFGFFESINDQAVADALLSRAAEWCRTRGLDVLRGPASFSTNDECGLLVDGFDKPPTIMTPHNGPDYIGLLERAGFSKAKDLLMYEGGSMQAFVTPPERLGRAVNIALQRAGVTLRPLNTKDFKEEVEKVKELYNACWEKNWGFIPMTDHEIDHLAVQFKPVVVPDQVVFAMKDGKPIGFALALPDFNVVFQKNRQGRMFPVVLKLLWALKRKTIRRARVLLLGVLPEFRGKGIDSALYHWIWTKSGDHGMYWAEGGWVLEDNPAIRLGLEKMTFKHYKTYRLYDRSIG